MATLCLWNEKVMKITQIRTRFIGILLLAGLLPVTVISYFVLDKVQAALSEKYLINYTMLESRNSFRLSTTLSALKQM